MVALISPGTVDTDGYAAAGAACAPVVGKLLEDRAAPLAPAREQPRAEYSVAESVAAMTAVIARLDSSYDGSHLDLHGDIVPW
jgi:hypothetical protein